MKEFVILSDSTCDLNKDLQKEFNIKVINAHYMDNLGNDEVSFNDWDNKDPKVFYKQLKDNPTGFSTAAPSINELIDEFETLVKDDKDILAFTITSKMSGTFNLYNQAKKEILVKYPDAKILIIDTLKIGAGIGLLMIDAANKRQEGKTIEEVYEYSLDNLSNIHQIGWLDDLYFVLKKGRINGAVAFFGSLIGIKPLGDFDSNGLISVVGKAIGADNAYKAMIRYMGELGVDLTNQNIIIMHTQRERFAEKYKDLIIENFHPKNVYISECGPSMGINVGPGLMAAYFIGNKSSENLENEKILMEKILDNK